MIFVRRDEAIDIMKGIAIVFVIYGHSHFVPIVGEWIYTFHMPLFFFLSGCLFKPEYAVVRNLKKLLLPYVSFVVIMCVVTLLVSYILAVINHLDVTQIICDKLLFFKRNFFEAILGNEMSFFFKTLWFLPVLFFVEYLYFILQDKFYKNISLICLSFLLISVYLFYHKINLPYFLDTILLTLPYYHCGRIFYLHKNKFDNLNIVYLFISVLIPIIAILVLRYRVDYKYNIVPWYNHIFSMMTIISAYLLFSRIHTRVRQIMVLGQYSIYYFGLHRTFFLLFLPLLNKFEINMYVQSVILCIITILTIYLLIEALGKRKKWLLLDFH